MVFFPEGTFYKPETQKVSKEIPVEGVHKKPKQPQPELDAKERIKTFEEVGIVDVQ